MLKFDIAPALKELRRDFGDFQRQQVPFASALALTRIAQNVQAAEVANMDEKLDHPTPFTKKGVAIIPAKKNNLTASVYVRDIQAAYLMPVETGGHQVLGGKRAILAPRGVKLNAYGNLPRGKLATLKAGPSTFVGKVTTKNGHQVGGVWKRTGSGAQAKLKLLIEFADPAPIKAKLGYAERAKQVIEATYRPAFEEAMAKAMSTAR